MTRRFEPTLEEEDFVVGRLDDEKLSGAYLPSAYLSRLREIRRAVGIRLSSAGAETPDALKNLLGVIDRLLDTHDQQITREVPGHITEIEKEFSAIAKELEDLRNGPRGPGKK
jgi:hypothetical protein